MRNEQRTEADGGRPGGAGTPSGARVDGAALDLLAEIVYGPLR